MPVSNPEARPCVMVRFWIDAVTPASTWKTRVALLPLTVTPAVGPVICTVPLLSSSWPLVRVILCGVLKFVSPAMVAVLNAIVFVPPAAFARPISAQ